MFTGWSRDGRTHKEFLHGRLAPAKKTAGRPKMHYNGVCIRDMKLALDMHIKYKGKLRMILIRWKDILRLQLRKGEGKIQNLAEDIRTR